MAKRNVNLNRIHEILPDSGEAITRISNNFTQGLDEAIEQLNDHPIFACFLIDASGSMENLENYVAEGQQLMLEALRESKKCKKEEALYILQYLFNEQSQKLQAATQLSKDGNDNVISLLLNPSLYKPTGMTALYDAVFELLQEMAAVILQGQDMGVRSEFTIGIITDGEENKSSKSTASDIQKLITELTQKEYLKSSVIVGLTSSQFSEGMLEKLRMDLGFSTKVSCDLAKYNTEEHRRKAIRNAFDIVSQSSIKSHY